MTTITATVIGAGSVGLDMEASLAIAAQRVGCTARRTASVSATSAVRPSCSQAASFICSARG